MPLLCSFHHIILIPTLYLRSFPPSGTTGIASLRAACNSAYRYEFVDTGIPIITDSCAGVVQAFVL